MVNSAETQIPWYRRTTRKTLQERVKAVQNVNDPTIVADDVQRWSTRFIWLLLAFTTLLSGFSYYRFFEPSFGVLSIFMAIALAVTIEFGKNWGFLKVLRIPFFMGWKHIQSEAEETIMWVGLLLLSIATFSASVYNSTHGAHQLSLLLGHERNLSEFKPNTAEIDAQIAATQSSMKENRAIKWQGVVTYNAQKAIQKESGVLDKLQAQRAATIDQQRKDWETQQTIKENQNAFSANSLLVVGGFVELIQVLLMFMRVASERSLDKVASERDFEELKSQRPEAFQSNGIPHGGHGVNPRANPVQNSSPIGFYWPNYGTTPAPQVPGVSHQGQGVSRQNSDDILRLARKDFGSWAGNIGSRKHAPANCSAHIHRILDGLRDNMRQTGFAPSSRVAIESYDYFARKLSELDIAGWPYDHKDLILEELRALAHQAVEA